MTPLRKLDIAASWRAAREELDAARAELTRVNEEHQRQLAALQEEMRELREVMLDVTAALRQKADSDVKALRRELERALLRLTPRDPTAPLN
jgi:hypothetical protein